MSQLRPLLLLLPLLAAAVSPVFSQSLPPPAFPPGVCAQPAARVCSVPGNYATLGEALAASPSCGTINLGAGAHLGKVTVDRSVTIAGAGQASTLITGGGGPVSPGSVLVTTGPLTGARACIQIRDVTITLGYADNGGGLLNQNAIVVVERAVIRNNQATNTGGGVYNLGGGAVRLASSVVRENIAGSRGAGIANNGLSSNFPFVSEINQFFSDISSIAQAEGKGGSVSFTEVPRVIAGMSTTVFNTVVDLVDDLASFDLYSIQFPMVLLDRTEVTDNFFAKPPPERQTMGLGAGLYNQAGIVGIVDHSLIARNRANSLGISGGGGIANLLGLLAIVDGRVEDNETISTIALGGGLFNVGAMELRNVDIARNRVEGYAFARGGGLQSSAGWVNLASSKVRSNTVSSITVAGGGGIGTDTFGAMLPIPDNHGTNELIAGVATVTESTISDNEVFSYFGASGGGIRNEESLTIERSTISGNKVRGGPSVFASSENTALNQLVTGARGGGVFTSNGDVKITASTISGNIVTSTPPHALTPPLAVWYGASRGGGIFNEAHEPDPETREIPALVAISPITDNDGVAVGGFSGVTLTRTTITGNSVEGDNISVADGGGVYNRAMGALSEAEMKIQGSIVAAGVGGTCHIDALPGFEFTAAIDSLGHNLESDDDCNFTSTGDIIHGDPRLGPLQDNGGPTLTHVLDATSIALDAGIPASVEGCQGAPDQRGTSGAYRAACDIGAVEGPLFVVQSMTPASNAFTALPGGPIAVVFSDSLNPATANAGSVVVRSLTRGPITGTFQYQDSTKTLTFQPAQPFAPGDTIAVSVTSRLRNMFGLPLARPRTWQFTTATSAFCSAEGVTQVGSLPGLDHGSIEWGDYDRDGDLDLLVTGIARVDFVQDVPFLDIVTEIYRNDGAGTFTPINAGLRRVAYGNATWGDYDNDGDLDVLVAGRELAHLNTSPSNLTGFAEIYRNDNGTFAPIGAGLPGVESGRVRWGDFDADGDLDVLLIGTTFMDPYEAFSKYRVLDVLDNSDIFLNDNGQFRRLGAALPIVYSGDGNWADYDGDGDLDVVIAAHRPYPGSSFLLPLVKVYRNDGGGLTPVDVPVGNVPITVSPSAMEVSWADADGDGDLDILLTGDPQHPGGATPKTALYRNTGGTFAPANVVLPDLIEGAHSWADYDGDGDLDLLISGAQSPIAGGTGRLLKNDGDGGFVDAGPGVPALSRPASAFGDLDGDGRLDIAISGRPNYAASTLLLLSPASCEATNDQYTTPRDEPLVVAAPGLLTNDTKSLRPLGSPSVVTAPANGQVTNFANGAFTYTPNQGFSGTDTFTYRATDGFGNSLPGTVSVTVLTRPVACSATADNGSTVFRSIDAAALRDAVAAAPGGGLVKVAGVCAGAIVQGGQPQVLFVDKNVTIRGGYIAGSWATPVPGARTVVDAELGGRGIRIAAGRTVALLDLEIRNGEAGDQEGGGIHTLGALSGERLVVTGNHARNGGGIATGASATLVESHLTANEARGSGGAIVVVSGGQLTLTRSTASGNTALQDGGAIRNQSNAPSVVRTSTVSGNVAGRNGGGISNGAGAVIDLEESTVYGNQVHGAFAFGGGVHNAGTTLRLKSTIVAGSTGGDCAGVIASLGTNLASDGSCNLAAGADLNGTDPRLSPLAANGGTTPTHALHYRSPAINAAGTGCAAVDQRGQARPNSGACDIGAFELALPPVVAEDDGYGVAANVTLSVSAAQGVLANDFNADGPTSALTVVLDSAPAQGTLTLDADGSFTYDPVPGFTGSVSFTYHARDGGIDSNVATVTLQVTTVLACAATIDGQTVYTSSDAAAVQQAMDNAPWDSMIKVAGACAGVNGTQTLFINRNITVEGGYAPTVTGDWIVRDPALYPTTLDAKGLGRVVVVGNAVVATIDGLTMTGGVAPTVGGAGIFNQAGDLTVRHSTVRANTTAAGQGGGILNESVMRLVDVAVSGNAVTSVNHFEGGGGIANTGTLTVTGSLIASNQAGQTGGGIWNLWGQASISTTTIRANTMGAYGEGAGIFNSDSAVMTIDRSAVIENIGYWGAGFRVGTGATLEITSSTVSGNVARSDAGALYGDGGSQTTIRSSTVTANSAWSWAGGLYESGGLIRIENSIVGGNIQGLPGNCRGAITSLGHNLGDDGTCVSDATDQTADDVHLGPLADNGGPTLTHAFTLASAAHEQGASCPAVDQRGINRPNGACDIGAVEYNGDPSILTIDDTYTTLIGQPLTVGAGSGVLANDFNDTATPSPTAVAVRQPEHGTVTLQANGGFTYTPQAGFAGDDSFTYRATAGGVQSNVATVRLGVRALLTCRASVEGGATFNSADHSAIQQAIDAAPAGGVVRVAGVCRGMSPPRTVPLGLITRDLEMAVYIGKNLTLRGGYDGTDWSVSNPVAYPTVIDADRLGQGIHISRRLTVTIENLTVTRAKAVEYGGALSIHGSTVTMRRVRILDSESNQGGGINLALDFEPGFIAVPASLTLVDSTVEGNRATDVGGGIYTIGNVASALIERSTIRNNTASFSGGGVHVHNGPFHIVNSTISGNRALDRFEGYGGGVNGGATIEHSTIAFNTAGAAGGGLGGGGFLVNTIVAGNTAPAGTGCGAPSVSGGHNLDDSGTCGLAGDGDIHQIDPLLAPLANNGGLTLTHALRPGSRAVNAGACNASYSTDQRGVARPQGPACDIGAVEASSLTTLSTSVAPGGSVTTDIDGDNATAADPVEVTVTSPNGGVVSIEERAPGAAPSGFTFLGREISLVAPPGSAATPLLLTFTLDASQLQPGNAAEDVLLFKNGVMVTACAGAGPSAWPDPCIASRVFGGDGDLIITARSSTASVWAFGVSDTPAGTLSLGANASINEGATFNRAVSITNAGGYTWTATVDYGDGSASQPVTVTAGGFTLNHAYPQSGSFTVSATVTDQTGHSANASLTLTVNNITPAVTVGSAASLSEGGTLTRAGSFTDPGADNWAAFVDYGDGTPVLPVAFDGSRAFTLGHTYTRSGVFTVSVHVSDTDNAVGVGTFTVTVANVAPTVTALSGLTASEGTAASFVLATFTDPGVTGGHQATIDWGDGTNGAGVVFESAGAGTVSGSHTYANQGAYTVTVVVTDEANGSSSATTSIVVANLPPTVLVGGHASIEPGQSLVRVGQFLDPGSDTWTAEVNYGDGTAGPLTVSGRTFQLSHTYAEPGTYPVVVTVHDSDGGTGTATFNATLHREVNRPPTITAIASRTIQQGESTGPIAFAVADPNTDDVLTVTAVSSNTTLVPAGGIVIASVATNQHTITVTPAADQSGTATITVTVTDGRTGTGATSFDLTVTGPGTPNSLTARVDGQIVELAWGAPVGGTPLTGYRIEAGNSPGTTSVSASTSGAATTFALAIPSQGQWFARVRGVVGSHAGEPSNEVAIVITGAPGYPRNLVVSAAGSLAQLAWAPPSNGTVQSYVVEAGRSPGATDIGTFPVGLFTSVETEVACGLYYVRVRAANAAGLSQPSNEVRLNMCGIAEPPQPPADLAATVDGSTVHLAWRAPAGGGVPDGYAIIAGLLPRTNWVVLTPVTALSQTVFNVAPAVYFVRVVAFNVSNGVLQVSDESNEIQVVVGNPPLPPGAPGGLTASTGPGGAVSLSWAPPVDGGAPTGYVVEAGSAPGLRNVAQIAAGSATTVRAPASRRAPTSCACVRSTRRARGWRAPRSSSWCRDEGARQRAFQAARTWASRSADKPARSSAFRSSVCAL